MVCVTLERFPLRSLHSLSPLSHWGEGRGAKAKTIAETALGEQTQKIGFIRLFGGMTHNRVDF